MEGKIKMPEKMARQLSENKHAMQYFDSLSLKDKKLFISNYSNSNSIAEYTFTNDKSLENLF